MLKEVDTNIWVAQQNLNYLGLEVGTRMTIIRLKNGELVVISPIKVNKEIINQINQLGKVSIIIAPNLYHHLFISDFKTAFPDAQIFAAPGLDSKRQDIDFDKIINQGKRYVMKYTTVAGVDGFDGTRKEAPKSVVKKIE